MKLTIMRYTSFAPGIPALILAAMLLLSGCGATPATEPASPSSGSIIVIPEASEPEASEPAVSENPSTPDVPSVPVSESSSAPAPAPAVAKTWWQELFSCEDTPVMVRHLYQHDNLHKLSYRNNDYYVQLSAAITASTEVTDLGKRILEDRYVELVMDSDDKYTVNFYEKGIELTHSHWKLKEKTTVKLAPPKNLYTRLKQKMDDMLNNTYPQNAMWLSMMNRGRIRSITVTDSKGEAISYNGDNNYQQGLFMMYLIEPYIRGINVSGAAQIPAVTPPVTDSAFLVEITFNNDVKYKVQVESERLYISSSDVAQTLSYELANGEQTTEWLQDIVDRKINPNTPNYDYSFTPSDTANPETGKPVIYLYPERATDCTVTVGYDSFSYTYPTYNDGWRVTAYPDGRLVNKDDGSEHYYLFWEGKKRVDWRFDSGFVVAGGDVERFLRDKLAYMGLTPREYNDFITYWVPRMQDNAYNLITFAGEQYEQLAPLTVTPAPDNILRVHMVYKAIDAPVTIPAQTLTPFVRKGFTVVEWGGSVTD